MGVDFMRRYYLSKVIGDGLTPETAFRAEIADEGVSHASVFSDPATEGDWCLCIVNTDDHGPLNALRDTAQLPDFPLDGKVNSINVNARKGLETAMQARGIPLSILGLADGYRDVINGIGRLKRATFDADAFDAG